MNIIKYLTSSKYRFFYKKLSDVRAVIWELDFKVAKTRQIREGVRQDRDRCLEAVNQIDAMLKSEKDKEKKENLEKEKANIQDTAKRYEAQMRMLDDEIFGVPAKGEDPGKEGINDRIKGYAELRKMYKEYAKTI